MPVQGGNGIKRSLDELVAACLSYDFSEPPRLINRLDRDGGILISHYCRFHMARATLLLAKSIRYRSKLNSGDDICLQFYPLVKQAAFHCSQLL
ncbi:hypothetical protein C1H46_018964 [Malus baccata]|uniref:Uncharacterized protein n=1 Tax=Malus baccata TaxID=106549 RepID=A0A540M9M6_MALBA|nr:hypothetical protein C1H46_018964 [Malus baccata]